MHVVIDTNVLVVANGRNCEQASPDCILACASRLNQIKQHGIVVLDSQWLILKQYMDNAYSIGQPGIGDAFLRWVLTNQANPKHCETVNITSTGQDNFAEFPQDPSLGHL
jgi:hypothetical protein